MDFPLGQNVKVKHLQKDQNQDIFPTQLGRNTGKIIENGNMY